MKYFSFIVIAFLFTGCSKSTGNAGINCDGLKQGLLNNDVTLINKSLGNYIVMDYSNEHLNALADTITQSCDVKASVFCYNCIKTLPPETEMYFAFVDNTGDSTGKVLDVTYTTDNKIKLVSVHE